MVRLTTQHSALLAVLLALMAATPGVARQPASSTDFAKMVEAVMDRSASPCDNFYQYACGGWLKSPASAIPADDVKASRVYQGGEMGARSDQVLYGILNTTDQPLLRAYFDSCLAATSASGDSEHWQENPGATARRLLKAPLALIDAIPDGDGGGGALDPSVLAATAALHKLGAKALFTVVVANDLMVSSTGLLIHYSTAQTSVRKTYLYLVGQCCTKWCPYSPLHRLHM